MASLTPVTDRDDEGRSNRNQFGKYQGVRFLAISRQTHARSNDTNRKKKKNDTAQLLILTHTTVSTAANNHIYNSTGAAAVRITPVYRPAHLHSSALHLRLYAVHRKTRLGRLWQAPPCHATLARRTAHTCATALNGNSHNLSHFTLNSITCSSTVLGPISGIRDVIFAQP